MVDRFTDADLDIMHHVGAIANVYSSERHTGIAHSFFSELKGMAKLSGKLFKQIFHDELIRINYFVGEQKLEDKVVGETAPILLPSEQTVVTHSIPASKKDPVVGELDFKY